MPAACSARASSGSKRSSSIDSEFEPGGARDADRIGVAGMGDAFGADAGNDAPWRAADRRGRTRSARTSSTAPVSSSSVRQALDQPGDPLALLDLGHEAEAGGLRVGQHRAQGSACVRRRTRARTTRRHRARRSRRRFATAISPRPSVVRSRVRSCASRISSSLVRTRSISQLVAPAAVAAWSAASVFSGAPMQWPRWPQMWTKPLSDASRRMAQASDRMGEAGEANRADGWRPARAGAASRIGVITGLRAEARCLERARRRWSAAAARGRSAPGRRRRGCSPRARRGW